MSKEEDKLITMEPGELELRKAFEDVTRNNVKTVIDYTTETRKLIRETQETLVELKRMIAERDSQITQLRQQVSLIQGKLYNGGTA